MAKLTTFICDKCHTFTKGEEKRGWTTLYAPLNPQLKKNTTFHLCPTCARDAIFSLWDDPYATADESKKLLEEKIKLDDGD